MHPITPTAMPSGRAERNHDYAMHGLPADNLRRAYGWASMTRPTLLHHGENRIIAFTADGRRFAARLCRPDADRARLEAEAAWLDALAPRLAVPRVVPCATGATVASVEVEGSPCLVLAFAFLQGEPLNDRDPASFHRLGKTLRRLHDTADDVLGGQIADWRGLSRPVYDPSRLHQRLSWSLRPGLLIDRPTRDNLLRVAKHATTRADDFGLAADRFVHADLHPGNVLVSDSGLVCLDFEECGFGPRVIDPGVVRFHLAAEGSDTDRWRAFLDGYGPHGWSAEELALGAVLRILHAVAKIPDRQDVPDISGRAPEILRRYLGLCESLLAGL